MAFLLFMTTWAMILNLMSFASDDQVLLTAVGAAILVLELWLLFEGAAAVRRLLLNRTETGRIPTT
jgi:carbon starvation protein